MLDRSTVLSCPIYIRRRAYRERVCNSYNIVVASVTIYSNIKLREFSASKLSPSFGVTIFSNTFFFYFTVYTITMGVACSLSL